MICMGYLHFPGFVKSNGTVPTFYSKIQWRGWHRAISFNNQVRTTPHPVLDFLKFVSFNSSTACYTIRIGSHYFHAVSCPLSHDPRGGGARVPAQCKWNRRIKCSSLYKVEKKRNIQNPFPDPSPNLNPNLYTEPYTLDEKVCMIDRNCLWSNG